MRLIYRRLVRALVCASIGVTPIATRAADPAPFDLAGPTLRVTVARGGTTLPIAQVPALTEGDTIGIDADFPEDQRARFLLVSAFLQGAINPPPKAWIRTSQPWKSKDKDRRLELVVPKGARQLMLFLVPASGGAAGAITDAVRGKPGEFVRATQELNQASLDRARLDAFMGAIRTQENSHPEYLRTVAPALARSLSIKINEDCLSKVIELQAACLLENRDSLVLADVHTSSMAETLIGAPADLAMQISSTREAGLGYYSPYIGVVRDIARVFGAFGNPELGYLPSLSLRHGDAVSLLLNAAPSFEKPRSVIVVSMPAIDADNPPRLRVTSGTALCGARPDLVIPVEGAPLVFATEYLRDPKLRLTVDGRPVDLPLTARSDRGGYVVSGRLPDGFKGELSAQLIGNWGFDAYAGPQFKLQFPTDGAWSVTGEPFSLVAGRDNEIMLTGSAPACVTGGTFRRGSAAARPIKIEPGEQGGLKATLPLKDIKPGELIVSIDSYGTNAAKTLTLRAYAQASRLEALTVHAGDHWGTLTGQRLDQVASVNLDDLTLVPDGLTRQGDTDQLRLIPKEPQTAMPDTGTARVSLLDGRTLSVAVTSASARPAVQIIERSLVLPAPVQAQRQLDYPGDGSILPDNARMIFSLRSANGTGLLSADAVEIVGGNDSAPVRLTFGSGLQLQGADVAVATVDAEKFGPFVSGPLQVRLLHGADTSDWAPLTTLARVPKMLALDCPADTKATCSLKGDGLFLVQALAATASGGAERPIPLGFTGSVVPVPRAQADKLYVKLRDSPQTWIPLRKPAKP